ncbi:MAG: sensor histidine kinase [Alphaproteobacteria bacterium]|nr:sensor histidine kinase [Alphaproteobacteria bacterium]
MTFGLRERLASVLVALALVIAIASTALFFRELRIQLVEAAHTDLAVRADLARVDLRADLALLGQDVDFLAEAPATEGLLRALENGGVDPLTQSTREHWTAHLVAKFHALAHSRAHYDQIRIIGLADGGREIVRVDRHSDGGELRTVEGAELQQKGDRPYVRDALVADHGTVQFSPIELNREGGVVQLPERPVVRASRVVHGPSGEPVAVVVVNLAMEPVFERLASRQPAGISLVVTNDRGQPLFGTDRDFAFERGDPADAVAGRSELGALLGRDVPADPAMLGTARDLRVGNLELAIALDQPRAAVTALAGRVVWGALLGVSFAALCALGVAIALSRAITRPLQDLADAIASARVDGTWRASPTARSLPETTIIAEAFDETWARAVDALKAQRRVEGELRRNNALLEQFAYAISHDLKAPLRGIRACADWIEADLPPDTPADVHENLGFIHDRAERLTHMVDGVLAYSAEVRTAVPEPEVVDTTSVVADVLRDLLPESALVEVTPDLPRVSANRDDVQRILQNLIGNALHHAPGARIVVSGTTEGEHAVLCVGDDGPGVPPELRERVFQLFQTMGKGGNGVGLTISREIARRHGGDLVLDASPSGGALFVLTLPSPPVRG